MQNPLCHRNMQNMQEYANYMLAICKNMQNMQSRFLYAKYAKICTPHFADGPSSSSLAALRPETRIGLLMVT